MHASEGQLIGLERDGQPAFDTIIVVTDRRILDQQIRDIIKQFAQVGATVGHAEHSGDLRRFLASGKKIIITTVQVIGLKKIGGNARAMVVTSGVERAIQNYHAIRDYLMEIKSPYKAIVAFSGEHEYGGAKVTEASLNGFPSSKIADNIQEDPYRLLIGADKFQTGYDEPLLHAMYVDKPLSSIKAVQTLSRLNRAHPQKHDVLVLDFMNDSETILEAFSRYYRTTILSKESDPNKLHDLKANLDSYQVYGPEHLAELVRLYLDGLIPGRLCQFGAIPA